MHWLCLINIFPGRGSFISRRSTYLLLFKVVVTNDVHVATGDVRVNGAVVPDSDKTDHVAVKPKPGSTTEGRVIKFKQLLKGLSKEVKLTR